MFLYHRTEKNAAHWSKDKLTALLSGLVIDDSKVGIVGVKSVTSIEGEAVANNRKGKLIFFYEWVIKCDWAGSVNGDSEEITGSFEIPNLSEENSASDITLDVTLKSSGPKADALKELVRTKGLVLVQDIVKKYMQGLKEEFAKDMIKPTKSNDGSINSFQSEAQSNKKSPALPDVRASASNPSTVKPSNDTNQIGVKLEVTNLQLSDSFKCTADEIYRTFTDVNLVQAFTQGKAVVDATVGGKFSLLDNNIHGKFTSLEPNKLIQQNWRLKTWPDGHFSDVAIHIQQREEDTQITVVQNGVPKKELERTEEGWKRYYFANIKRTFGFGSSMF